MIKLQNVSSGYGKTTVLNDVSLSVEKGEFLAIIGPNGCGKTTLLKTIVNIIPTFSGNIILDGVSTKNIKQKDIAKKISYLSQGMNTDDMSVFSLALMGRFPYLSYPRRFGRGDRAIAASAIERMGLKEYSDTGLSKLSGGMRQRAYIAMALAQSTDFILLDEPTTYLDITHQLELMKILSELCREGKSIIAVMHDLPMALSFAHKIAVMDGGKILALGTPQEISASGIIEKIFGVSLDLNGKSSYYYKFQ